MGGESIIWVSWIAQVIAAAGIAVYSAFRRRWFATAGTVLGIALGFLPLQLFQGPAVWQPWILMAAASTVVLLVDYIVTMRWKRFLPTLLLLGIPLAYTLVIRDSLPPEYDSPLLAPIGVIGDMSILFAPILCALAFREVLGGLDRLIAIRRSA